MPVICAVKISASITASATFGHSASPDNVTCWHTMVLQWAMKVCVKYFSRLCHRNPMYSNYLQTHFYFNDLQESQENQIVTQIVYSGILCDYLIGVLAG